MSEEHEVVGYHNLAIRYCQHCSLLLPDGESDCCCEVQAEHGQQLAALRTELKAAERGRDKALAIAKEAEQLMADLAGVEQMFSLKRLADQIDAIITTYRDQLTAIEKTLEAERVKVGLLRAFAAQVNDWYGRSYPDFTLRSIAENGGPDAQLARSVLDARAALAESAEEAK